MADQHGESVALDKPTHGLAGAGLHLNESKLNLEKMCSAPTWKEVLYDLVLSEKLDPWNIDVVFITEEYIGRVKKLKQLDLRLSANLVLAASILLKYKSDAIKIETAPQPTLDEFAGEFGEVAPIGQLELSDRIPPKRQVTLEELVGALEDAFEFEKKRMERKSHVQTRLEAPSYNIILPEFDIEEEMENVMAKIESMKDKDGFVLFSSMIEGTEPIKTIYLLLPTLHLAQQQRLGLMQEKFFGDIILYCMPEKQEEGNGKKEADKGAHAGKQAGSRREISMVNSAGKKGPSKAG
ncbi:MAG: segregation/condensation protein A [Candidatus Micrarchaeia archaeon]